MPNRRIRIMIALALFILIILPLLSNGIDLIVDWLWFKQEGFRLIYWTILTTQIRLSGLVGVGFMALTAINLGVAHSLSHRHGYRVEGEYIEYSALDRFGTAFRWVIWAGVLFIGYVVGEWSMSHWMEYQMAGHSQMLGQADPLFGIDLGFYLFRLPFTWFLYYLSLLAVIVCLLSAAFLYLVEGGIWVTPRGPKVMGAARTHLMVLGAVLFVVLAYRVRLAMYGLLFSPRAHLRRGVRRRARLLARALDRTLPVHLDSFGVGGRSEAGKPEAGDLLPGPSGGGHGGGGSDLPRNRAAFHRGP